MARNELAELRAARAESLLTAGDIAKHIQRRGESFVAAVDRLRNWTDMGIIIPTGDRYPGTGRKKQYTSDALLRAVILQTLVDTMRAPATSLSVMLAAVEENFRAMARGMGRDLIILSRDAGGMDVQFATWEDLSRRLSKSDLAVHTVVDLGQIYARVVRELDDIPPKAARSPDTAKILRGAMARLKKPTHAKKDEPA